MLANQSDTNFTSAYGQINIAPDFKYRQGNKFDTFEHIEKRKDTIFSWKIHLSLYPEINNVKAAWSDIIIPILMQHQIGEFKIALPSELKNAKGKIITIYLAYNTELQITSAGNNTILQAMLQEIEEKLVHNNILPGENIRNDARINGSQFFYYRCELGKAIEDDHRPDDEEPFYGMLDESQAEKKAKKLNTLPSNPYNHIDQYGLSAISIRLAQPNIQPDIHNLTL